MTAISARLRPAWTKFTDKAVVTAGTAVGNIGRGLPGTAGPLAIAYGFHEIYAPLGWIVAGVFLLALDRRVP